MGFAYKLLARPLAFLFDAETMHRTALRGLGMTDPEVLRGLYYHHDSGNELVVGCVKYPAVAGLAAGYDKYGQLIDVMPHMSAGHEELGTITPYAHDGNPRPRLFRLVKDGALINRMGLNNCGLVDSAKMLGHRFEIPLNISLDPNVFFISGEDETELEEALHKLWAIPYAKILNISCPNTSDGKAYESPDKLDALLRRTDTRNRITTRDTYVKFSHDLTDDQLGELIDVCGDHYVTGFVIGNTSNSRNNLSTPAATIEKIGRGGLSGAPLLERKLEMVRYAKRKDGKKAIIGAGGIGCTDAAPELETYMYLLAGADMVQVFTGIPYRGFGIFREIDKGLPGILDDAGFNSVEDFRRRRG